MFTEENNLIDINKQFSFAVVEDLNCNKGYIKIRNVKNNQINMLLKQIEKNFVPKTSLMIDNTFLYELDLISAFVIEKDLILEIKLYQNKKHYEKICSFLTNKEWKVIYLSDNYFIYNIDIVPINDVYYKTCF